MKNNAAILILKDRFYGSVGEPEDFYGNAAAWLL